MGFLDAAAGLAKTGWDIFAQNKTWEREDSAVQRRVADLKAAGLSPTLAAGSAASTSSPIQVNQPTPEADYLASKQMAKAMLKQDADISRTKTEEALIEQQRRRAIMENAPLDWLARNKLHIGVAQGGLVTEPWEEYLGKAWLEGQIAKYEAAKLEPAEVQARIDESQARKALATEQYLENAHDYAQRKTYGVLKSDSGNTQVSRILQLTRLLGSPAASAAKDKVIQAAQESAAKRGQR